MDEVRTGEGIRQVLKVFGLTREEAAARLAEVLPWDLGVRIEFVGAAPELHIVLSVPEGREETLAQVAGAVRERLGEDLFGCGAETLDSVLAALFRATGATLSLAESCTGGLIAGRITEQAGSSGWLLEGIVSYSNAAKSRLLRVSPELLKEHGAVSSEVAMAMASGARDNSGSDLALAVTGIAGPEGGSPQKPVGTVYIALADREGCRAERHLFAGDRQGIRNLTVLTALDRLRRRLLTLYRMPPRG